MTRPDAKRHLTPSSLSAWSAAGLRLFGMAGLVACFVVWLVTPAHLVEPLFVTAFGSILAFGWGADALGVLRLPPAPPNVPLTHNIGTEEEPPA